jgi:hypothetical protein
MFRVEPPSNNSRIVGKPFLRGIMFPMLWDPKKGMGAALGTIHFLASAS